MTEAQKQKLQAQLWRIANELRGKMDADEFCDYKVGFFAGQELNRTTYNLARMNMILHDVHFSRFDKRSA